ncbi:MAG: hypothetical protein ABI333_14925 [bacterium]
MKPRHIATLAFVLALTAASAAARATHAPELTAVCYEADGWTCASIIDDAGSCDGDDTNCYFIAKFCDGDDPDVVEDARFYFGFDFSSSGTFEQGIMYRDDERNYEVFDYDGHFGSTWMMYSQDTDIEWDRTVSNGPTPWIGRIKISLSGTNYYTYVYVQRVVC